MTSKDLAIKTIQELLDSATWEDIEARVRFLAGIDRGLADIKAGKVVPHEEVKESLKLGPRDLEESHLHLALHSARMSSADTVAAVPDR